MRRAKTTKRTRSTTLPAASTSNRARQRRHTRRPATSAANSLPGGGSLLLVNMIPKSLSDETNQDSETSLAVNPSDINQIVGTAFTPDPLGGSLAPIFVSEDGGTSWQL